MLIREAMTPTPACCRPDSAITDVARLMVEHDCGAIPVTETGKPDTALGILTDRDITTRVVAKDKNPEEVQARNIMTGAVASIDPNDDIDEAVERMAEKKVRRLVVQEGDQCVGLISLADIARNTSTHRAGQLLQEISEPMPEPSEVMA